MGSPVWIRWEPQALEAETWRYVDGKGETVAQSDVTLNGSTVQQLHAGVLFRARSAAAAADRLYACDLARYEMRMELYRANGNDGDDPGQHVGNDGPGPNEQDGLDSASD
ncbi:MAG: hypothetical protein M1839_000689 [Geoglossum umbratile]|nr:MAG: hypothetical protein M1839_000689 [Geoglossum umbratile]